MQKSRPISTEGQNSARIPPSTGRVRLYKFNRIKIKLGALLKAYANSPVSIGYADTMHMASAFEQSMM